MASKKQSFLDYDDDDDVNTLTINEDYAKKYSTWRAKEEKQKLETRFGIEVEESSSSESEEEDEDGQLLTGEVDASWLQALNAVRKNDPKIYNPNFKFFQELPAESTTDSSGSDSDDAKPKEKKSKKDKVQKKKDDDKPLYMKDYERKLILEKGGILSESEEDSEAEKRLTSQTYAAQQEKLKKNIKTALADVSSDDEDSELLKQKVKTKKEHEEEDEEYLLFLKGQKKAEELRKDKHLAEELAPLKDFIHDPGLDRKDKELWDFLLEQKYRSKNKHSDQDWYLEQMAQLQADEEVDEAERKYNFRFEEPDTDFIKTYERNPKDTLRQKDNKRAQKRQEIKDRKLKEKEKLMEEIRQLKNLKRKEIMDKLDKLKEVTGNADFAFTSKDIEEEFDPAAYDKMMEKYFGDDFYKGDDQEKPTFADEDDDEYEDDDWDNWKGRSSGKKGSLGPDTAAATETAAGTSYEALAQDNEDAADFNMDADYDPSQPSYTSGKKKKKSKFKQLMEKNRPTFEEVCKKYESSDHPFGEYLDEYFKLDCEDIIAGDVKCRFHYRRTVPNDYGLTVEEVLRCPDKELNSWASLKKITQFRNEKDELYEVRQYKKSKKLRKKCTILPSLNTEISEEPELEDDFEEASETKHGDRETEDGSLSQESLDVLTNELPVVSKVEQSAKEKKKKRKADESGFVDLLVKRAKKVKENDSLEQNIDNPNDRLAPEHEHKVEKVNNTNKKSKQKMQKEKRTDLDASGQMSASQKNESGSSSKNKKIKKKQKKKAGPSKKPGYSVGAMSTESRLVALGIDPRKFKYTKQRILHEPTTQ